MSLRTFSLARPLNSYSKIQALASRVKRNSRSQLSSNRITGKEYLNVGCGPNTDPRYINLEYNWHPGIDLCWDITKGIPLQSASLKGIFSEHCLEHFSLKTGIALIKEFRRLLSPGGRIRLALPDAELYLSTYYKRLNGITVANFPYEADDRVTTGLRSAMVSVNRAFYVDRESLAGHCCMYDFELISEVLSTNGFTDVVKCSFRSGSDPTLLIDAKSRQIETFYVEAVADDKQVQALKGTSRLISIGSSTPSDEGVR